MEITVNEQAQRFYMALDKLGKWVDVVGHEIRVGEYRFFAAPVGGYINVSEVTTGAKFLNIKVNFIIESITQTQEDFVKYCYEIGESIKRIIEKKTGFDAMLADVKKKAFDHLGEMPPIKDVKTNE